MRIKNYLLSISIILLLGSFMTSCATTETPEEGMTIEIDMTKVTEAREKADTAKNAAQTAKAEKAAADEYKAAEALYKEGMEAEKKMESEAAYTAYVSAEEGYKMASDQAEANKKAAMEAMSAADDAISNAEMNAESAINEATEAEQ